MTKTALILFSGGADSVLMVLLAKKLGRKVSLITFQYGQKHKEELDYADRLVEKLWPSSASKFSALTSPVHLKVDLSAAFANSESNLLANSESADYPGVHPMHVPARNLVFLATAIGIAESMGLDEVWHGADWSDRIHQFPDCFPEWFVKLNELAAINGSRKIEVKAPLLGLSKEDVLALVKAEGIALGDVFSGYTAPQAATSTR